MTVADRSPQPPSGYPAPLVGTAKRERHKAARQAKLEQLAKEQAKKKRNRTFIRLGLAGAAFILVTIVLVQLFGGSDDDSEVSAGAPTTSAPTGTTAVAPTTNPPGGDAALFGTTPCPPTDGSGERQVTFDSPFQQCIDPAKSYTAEVTTSQGSFTIELQPARAPGAVNNFVSLARSKYFDGTICHRVVQGFVVQCGDPDGTGRGGPGFSFADELPGDGEYRVGSVAMANSGPDTNGSQFFVITGDDGAALPPNYTLFGQVTDGLDTTVVALDALAGPGDGPPTQTITIETVTITES